MNVNGILDRRMHWFCREIELSKNQQSLLDIIKGINGATTYGLAGGDARNLFIEYDGPYGDAGIDIFAPDFGYHETTEFERLATNLFMIYSNKQIIADNLGKRYGEISLAGFSYFNTPTVSISKVLVLHTIGEAKYYIIGHESALIDKEKKVLRIDYPKHERNISVEENKSVKLGEHEVISGSSLSDNNLLELRIARLNLDNSDLVETRTESVEVSDRFEDNLRYGILNWSSLAKIVNLAVMYSTIDFQLDSSTESVLSQISQTLSQKDSRKAAIHIAYKLHPEHFGILEQYLSTKEWLGDMFSRSDEDTFNNAWRTLKKYKGYKKVVLQNEDYIFDKVLI